MTHADASGREQIGTRSYDIAIVGGGIAGAGIARDAARRGFDTILLDRSDFGDGTTAGSTRLAHGGLRYLEHYEFGLVREGLRERETLAEIAPHLVDPLTFLIPSFEEPWYERLKLKVGISLYDVLSWGKSMPTHDRLSADDISTREPDLVTDGLQGGFAYADRQIPFPERLCLENVLAAHANGADVLPYAEVTGIRSTDGSVSGVTVTDRLLDRTVDVDATVVINATGPSADALVPDGGDTSLVRPIQGIHLVTRSLTEHAMTLPTTDDRIVFIVPWHGYSLIGTTEHEVTGDPEATRATSGEIEYLFEEVSRYFPSFGPEDVYYTTVGVRPLYQAEETDDPSAVSRAHEIVDHGAPNDGLYSVVGAKITPYRGIAEETVDTVAGRFGTVPACVTAEELLPGGGSLPTRPDTIDDETATHLESLYGSRVSEVYDRIEADSNLAAPLCKHSLDILAQVDVAVETEFAAHVDDVLFRRLTVGHEHCVGSDAIDPVLDRMATLLDWDAERQEAERERFNEAQDRRLGPLEGAA